jgi:hypothetical protein
VSAQRVAVRSMAWLGLLLRSYLHEEDAHTATVAFNDMF